MERLNLTREWDKVFPKSDKVEHGKLTGDNKELLIIPGASHTDLYDQMDVIPFEKLGEFFEEHLK